MNAISASGLNVCYRRRRALIDCTLEVPEGRITAVVGINGAGKTTLLNCLVGLVRPSSGQATVLGGLAVGSAEARQRVSFVAQDSPLYGNLTVSSMLSLTECLNRDFDHSQARRRFDQLELPENRKIGELSFGQQAQISLTLALARRPDLLIMDEPLARLDPIARKDFMRLVLSTAVNDGVSVMLSSHVVAELEPVADYLVLIHEGRVLIAEEIDTFLARHFVLTGPVDRIPILEQYGLVLGIRKAARQAKALLRNDSFTVEIPDGWEREEVFLEELLLTYLGGDAMSDLQSDETYSNVLKFPTCML